MASAEIQTLLRFLSQDAKLPLASAMGKVMDLQKANLVSYGKHPESLHQMQLTTIEQRGATFKSRIQVSSGDLQR
jgi:hypothetical protein